MTGLDRLARLASSASLVVAIAGGSLAVSACASSADPEPTGSSQSSEALSTGVDAGDDAANPADKASLGQPGLVGASPVVPSPWDHLVGGASK